MRELTELSHDNVVKLLFCKEAQHNVYLVMEVSKKTIEWKNRRKIAENVMKNLIFCIFQIYKIHSFFFWDSKNGKNGRNFRFSFRSYLDLASYSYHIISYRKDVKREKWKKYNRKSRLFDKIRNAMYINWRVINISHSLGHQVRIKIQFLYAQTKRYGFLLIIIKPIKKENLLDDFHGANKWNCELGSSFSSVNI